MHPGLENDTTNLPKGGDCGSHTKTHFFNCDSLSKAQCKRQNDPSATRSHSPTERFPTLPSFPIVNVVSTYLILVLMKVLSQPVVDSGQKLKAEWRIDLTVAHSRI